MVGIEPPGESRLPVGPQRDLVLALHDLYRGAGRPSLRRIAGEIIRGQYSDTVSHETASAILRGDGVPRWSKLECLVRQLAVWHHPHLEPDEQVGRFLALWNAASSPGASSEHDKGSEAPASALRSDRTKAMPFPAVWGDVPYRNQNFTGRADLLTQIHRRFRAASEPVNSLTLYGFPGIGKTQMAIEYAYRYRSDYDLVWWIPAEQLALIRPSLAALANRLGLEGVSTSGIEGAAWAALEALRRGEPFNRWLLIYDDAEYPQEIIDLIPRGLGDVLITSRYPGWREVSGAAAVDVLSRAESIEFLTKRMYETIGKQDACLLAAALGDLPLALDQAAALLTDNGMPVAQYVRLLSERPRELLAQKKPSAYPLTMTATWDVTANRLMDKLPESYRIAQLPCLF